MSFIIGVVISRPGLLGEPLPVHILVLSPAGINAYLPRVNRSFRSAKSDLAFSIASSSDRTSRDSNAEIWPFLRMK